MTKCKTPSFCRLLVQLAAYPSPRFTWFVNGDVVRPDQRRKVSYDNGVVTLVIINAQQQDSGEYVLKAKNDLGETTCKTTLNIQRKRNDISLQSSSSLILKIHDDILSPLPAGPDSMLCSIFSLNIGCCIGSGKFEFLGSLILGKGMLGYWECVHQFK